MLNLAELSYQSTLKWAEFAERVYVTIEEKKPQASQNQANTLKSLCMHTFSIIMKVPCFCCVLCSAEICFLCAFKNMKFLLSKISSQFCCCVCEMSLWPFRNLVVLIVCWTSSSIIEHSAAETAYWKQETPNRMFSISAALPVLSNLTYCQHPV